MYGIWCGPEIAQCGEVCVPDETGVCPSQDEIFEIMNDPQPPDSYEVGLQCDFEYVFTGSSANDLECTPLTMCSFNIFNDNTWVCAMSGIWCDPEIEYEDGQAQCGDACEPDNDEN